MCKLGMEYCKSSIFSILFSCISSAVKTFIEIGVSCAFSDLFCAVTSITSSVVCSCATAVLMAKAHVLKVKKCFGVSPFMFIHSLIIIINDCDQ